MESSSGLAIPFVLSEQIGGGGRHLRGWGKFDQDRCLISDFREDALAGCAAPKLHDLQFLLARAAAGGLGLDEVGVVLGAEGGAEGGDEGREALNGFVIEERRTLSHRR